MIIDITKDANKNHRYVIIIINFKPLITMLNYSLPEMIRADGVFPLIPSLGDPVRDKSPTSNSSVINLLEKQTVKTHKI